ncbi:MAG: hypothetical protein K0Q66_279 [Chitinophagaceae bacterium]|jgi:hypothetical protein|nr:hypothetical protein [Chitinophagaceae bacterium]
MAKAAKKTSALPGALGLILHDKTIKVKQKTALAGEMLLNGSMGIGEFVATARTAKATDKATLIEAMEYASKLKPEVIDTGTFEFAIRSLADEAPRVKWESARLIGNTAHLFPKLLKKAIVNLLANTEHEGTVVRWSAAGAISKIMQCNMPLNKDLLPAAEAIIEWETDNAVRKIYQQAIKKVKK